VWQQQQQQAELCSRDSSSSSSSSSSALGSRLGLLLHSSAGLQELGPALLLAWVLCNLCITAVRSKEWYELHYPEASLQAAVLPGLL
jgi:hypothetical protein